MEGHLWWNKRNWGYRSYTDQAGLNAAYEEVVNKLEPLIRDGLVRGRLYADDGRRRRGEWADDV